MFKWLREEYLFDQDTVNGGAWDDSAKEMLLRGVALVEATEFKMAQPLQTDLTGRMQLKDDCDRIKRLFVKLCKKKGDEAELLDKIEHAIQCLETTSSNLLH